MRYSYHSFFSLRLYLFIMATKNIVVILAGGLGKRMHSDIPKVLHLLFEKPMLVHVIEQARLIHPEKIFVVVGKYKDLIVSTLEQYVTLHDIEFILQEEPLGTGHAVQCCKSRLLDYQGHGGTMNVLILSGDVPLIQKTTLVNLLNGHGGSLVVTEMENPAGYGRIVVRSGEFVKIVEEKDCTEAEKRIQQVNCGIYAFDVGILCKHIDSLTNQNAQKEYYLTDILEIIQKEVAIGMYTISKERQFEIMGVNTVEQLLSLEATFAYVSL